MKIEKINSLLNLNELKSGLPFLIMVNDKKYKGILIQHKTQKNIEEFLNNNNLIMFALRENDNDDMVPETIENYVFINKFGDFILEKGEFELKNKDYETIQDYSFL